MAAISRMACAESQECPPPKKMLANALAFSLEKVYYTAVTTREVTVAKWNLCILFFVCSLTAP